MSSTSTQQPAFQFTLRSLLAIIAVVAILFGAVAFVREGYRAAFEARPGVVENLSEWPDSLQELLGDARKANIEVGSARLYSLNKRAAFDPYYYLQMRSSPAFLALLGRRWPLKPATSDEVNRFWRTMPAGWAKTGNTSPRHYSASWGQKSDNVVVMVDGATNLVYVLYYFNF